MSHPPTSPSIAAALEKRAAQTPERIAYTFLGEGPGEEKDPESLTYRELEDRARGVADFLVSQGQGGERVLLLYPPGLDFIAGFFGCLYAGSVAVPAYPPGSRRTLPRVRAIARDAAATVALTTSAHVEKFEALSKKAPELAPLTWKGTDGLVGTGAFPRHEPAPGDVAFLQYTSGSTAAPKGVMVTHGNLVHNEEMIRLAFDLTEDSVIAGWLPLYHDMGLIGNVLQPLWTGSRCVLMSPISFLRQPRRWLEAIHEFRATTSGGPNFAYDLCVRRIPPEERDGLDLSSWTVAFNGAEPVRAETLERFAEAFAPCGFRREAFYPCYGLAEGTLLVSGGQPQEPPPVVDLKPESLERGEAVPSGPGEDGRRLVGCGQAWQEQRIAVVDEETGEALPEGRVGEIWVSGGSVAAGYWQRPEETERDFQARLPEDDGTWLRTGDLGFLRDGELFVTGRAKDLIILRGRNHYPQDFELTVERSHPDLRPGCGAAFSVDVDGEESLVVVQELVRKPAVEDFQEVVEAAREAVATEHEARLHELVLIRWGSVPKTSSGKIQRRRCRALYLEGELAVVARGGAEKPGTSSSERRPAEEPDLDREALEGLVPEERAPALLKHLKARAAQVLRCEPGAVAPEQSLVSLGLDSLAAVELQQAVASDLGVEVGLGELLDGATVAGLAEEVLSRLGDGESVAVPVARQAREGRQPLSRGQAALWFLQRLAPESAAYHITAAADVEGAVDARALGRALGRLTERHELLRATFPAAAGEPVLQIHESLPPAFSVEMAETWTEQELDERSAAEAYRPFDLERGPLLRTVLFRRGPRLHRLVFAVHHLVADFWSLGILTEELAALYGEETDGPAAHLPEVGLAYGDYVAWQEERLAGPAGEAAEQHWQRRLGGGVPPLDLPTDRPRPPVQTDAGGRCSSDLGAELTDGLRRLAAEAGATPFAVAAAGLLALFHRLSGQGTVTLGTPAAGRTAAGLAPMVGYFVNPVVLASEASGEVTFRDFLASLRQDLLDALAHQDFPFPLLAERLQPVRDPSRTPLFQVLLTEQKPNRRGDDALGAFALGTAGAEMSLGPLKLVSRELADTPVQFDLSFVLASGPEGLGAALQYNRDLFDATTAQRLLERWRILLAGAAAGPELPLGDLPVMAEAERRHVLAQINATATPLPEITLHGLFEAQAAATPGAPALTAPADDADDEEPVYAELTYAELEGRANQLARHLAGLGVGAEMIVGVATRRSADMVAALLGILKAGGTYLPLDPAYPKERIAFTLEDSGAAVVVTDRASAGSLEGFGGRLLFLDGEPEEPSGEGGEEPRRPAWTAESPAPLEAEAIDPRRLAYVIYTSGSTGRPKGVQIPHRAAVNFLRTMARRPGIVAEDVLVAVTTLSFDIAGLELFLPLASGAQVVLADRATASDGAALLELLQERQATFLQATPATWRLLLAAGWNGEPRLQALCGGEALPKDLAAQVVARSRSLWNVYGPTETTIWSAVHRVSRESGEAPGGVVSIGRPIANTSLYLLDRRGRLTAPGTPGELVIGGSGVARGYLGRPALTAERFVPDPFSGEPGSRLYRTGDLVRLRPDDRFEYLSRLDHQVKIRGHRIELGEIEAALEGLPSVAQAVVTARELRPGDVALVAYLVAAQDGLPSREDLREELRERLPEAFLPSVVVPLEALPLTPNGKVDRKALPAPSQARPDLGADYAAPKSGLERLVAEVWAEVLGMEKVGLDDNFFDLGGHSLLVAQVHGRLEEQLGAQLTMVDFFRHPTVRALAGHLEVSASGAPAVLANRTAGRAAGTSPDVAETAIAIVGMAGRFPGASSVDALWELLREGREAITVFEDEELMEAGVAPALLENPAYVKASGHLAGADRFDAAFFGIHGREAELMDPQHRLFLETAWHGLEDAGYDPSRDRGRIGVFAGVGIQTYAHEAGLGGGTSEAARYQAFIGNDKDFVPTRVSYKLDLKGPSVNVQTACSSSLVAVHLAARSLLAGESDMALAGGVTVRTPLKAGYVYEDGGIPSPDGHCRPFDAEAAGTVFGNGAAVVVLKRLDRALADGDRVRAVLRGSAINNDGAAKIGYTAPSVDGQAQVVADALQAAGVSAGTISYVEAHGTGTPLGDPIEVTALKEAFSAQGAAPGATGEGRCVLGSVKSNLGHLDTAAGVTGLIKTVLALEHGELPPTLHFRQANPKLGLEGSPFRVAAELEPWARAGDGAPRRAGVSSFGIGGTNAHVILEEAPKQVSGPPRRRAQLLMLSAKSPEALDRRTAQLAEALSRQGDSPEAFADAAFTLSLGRKALEHRRILVAGSGGDAAEALAGPDPARVHSATAPEEDRPVAFLFSGQGSQYPDMGRELYETEPVFRREVDRCCDLLEPLLGRDLRPLLYPEISEGESGEREEAAERLARTAFTQPALFVIEVALARLWQSWGVKPTAMLGHSIGELVAAHLAGVFDLPSALRLVAARGRLMQSAPEGSMLGVELPEEELTPLLGDALALATVNGERDCVAAGPDEAVDALAASLEEKGVRHRRLRTSHAFHSSMMDGILDAFREEVAKAEPQAPKIPFVSNVTGTWIRPEEATDPAYWGRQIRSTVRFADGVRRLLEEPAPFLLELGPGRTLSTLARKLGATAVAPSLPHPRQPEPDGEVILGTLGRLWLAGGAIDWHGFWQGEKRRRTALPLYPFEGKRYWLEARPAAASGPADARRPDPADWLSVPLWRQAPPRPRPALNEDEHWLVLADEAGVSDALLDALETGFQDGPVTPPVTVVQPGEAFEKTEEDLYLLRPGVEEDFNALAESLQKAGRLPSVIVHGWSLAPEEGPADAKAVLGRLEESRLLGPETLVALARALERTEASECRWTYLTNGLFALPGEKVQRPEGALALGPLRVIPQELSGHRCRVVDLPLEGGEGDAGQAFAEALLAEAAAPVKPEERHVALRTSGRWLRGHGPLRLEAEPTAPRLREGGVYLVTGGLGGLGLAVAEDLARRVRARLALVGRRSLPPRQTWQELIGRGPVEDPLVRLLQRLLAMEEAGAEVLPLVADVTDGAALEAALLGTEDRFGPLHGVIHAAGIAGGTLLQRRNAVEAKAVQAPKVEGTLILCDTFKDRDLDFLALFSSVTGTAGGVGQTDYCSANAFQDAVAASFSGAGRYTVAIGWDRWEEVGMAVRSARTSGGGAGAGMATGHPLLGAVVEENPQRQVFVSELAPEHHWVLSEHLIAGRPTVPGTTFLEMARAAHQRRVPGPVALSEVAFLAPLSVDEGERRQVVTVLEGDAGKRSFRVTSRPAGDEDAPWQDHVRGSVAAAAGSPGEPSDLEELARRCGEREITAGQRASEQVKGSHGTFLVTGPRWSSLKSLSTSGMESLARLELAPEHGDDLQLFPLHPALMDVAAGAVQFLAEGNFLPLAYERLILWRPLSRRTFSHLKLQSEVDATAETLTCDIRLLDARGAEVARVEGFSMKRVGEAMAAQLAAGAAKATAAEGAPVVPPASDPFASATGLQLPAPETEGIRPEEGVAVLRSILDGGTLPQILVTPRELAAVEAETDSFDLAKLAEEASAAGPATLHERPSVSSEFVAPEDGPERKIAEVWQRVLGLEQVGVHDNFFELGGTSLNGVQLVSELKKELGVEIPTVSIFEAPTVSALAKYLEPKDDDEEAFSDARDRAERKRQALARRPPPRRPRPGRSRSRRKP